MFVADEVPPEFDPIVGGRCLAVPLAALDEIVRVAARRSCRRIRTPPRGVPVVRDATGPTLLARRRRPAAARCDGATCSPTGYAVTPGRERQRAIELLELRDFDAIVVDWHMHDGSGADVYRWILKNKPHLAARVVFLVEADQDDTGPVAPGRPMFRKGQDSQRADHRAARDRQKRESGRLDRIRSERQ